MSTKILYYCDLCGKQFHEIYDTSPAPEDVKVKGAFIKAGYNEGTHVCEECINKMIEVYKKIEEQIAETKNKIREEIKPTDEIVGPSL